MRADAVEVLKQTILKSPDVQDDLSRKFLLWALGQTDGLTKEVIVAIGPSTLKKGPVLNAMHSAHNMDSSLCKTHFSKVMSEVGTDLFIYADNTEIDGKNHYALSFLKDLHKVNTVVQANWDEINAIQLDAA
jgi:hypothetical protein